MKYDIEYSANNDTFKDFVFKQSTEYEQEIFEDEVVTLWVNSSGETSEKIPPYSGITVDDYTAELKRLGLPYQVLMCPTENVLEGYVVSISGGNVGDYYNGIHLITVYEAFKPNNETTIEDNDKKFVEVQGYKISTDLTELTLCGPNTEHASGGIYNNPGEYDIGDGGKYFRLTEPITDLSFLKEFKNLVKLEIDLMNIPDISYINELTTLKDLWLFSNNISNIDGISRLSNLECLYIWETSVSDINELSKLEKLRRLTIDGCQINDLNAVSTLTELTYLSIYDTPVSDISAIVSLTKLEYLHLTDNYNLKKSDANEIQNALPNCHVVFVNR